MFYLVLFTVPSKTKIALCPFDVPTLALSAYRFFLSRSRHLGSPLLVRLNARPGYLSLSGLSPFCLGSPILFNSSFGK
jgi:hypothetical protein